MFTERFKSHHQASMRLKDLYRSELEKEEYLTNLLQSEGKGARALYVHVPYCTKLCRFCGFPQGDRDLKKNYHNIVIKQINKIKDFPYLKQSFQSVYFGGGTPTSLEPFQMAAILKAIHENFNLEADCEVSVETSVTELSTEMIDALWEGGVNRLSIGIQTFDDCLRKKLGRRGSSAAAIAKIKELKAKGFTNVNIDLIYNNPGQTREMLNNDLQTILDLELAGISFYSLMLNDKSPMKRNTAEDELLKMKDINWEYEQFETIVSRLKENKFELFEFTKLIRERLDEYKYIQVRQISGDVIAIGLGAGGKIGNYSYYNMFDMVEVSDALPISAMGSIFDDAYFIYEDIVGELQKGHFTLSLYNNRLNTNLETILLPTFNKFIQEGLAVYEKGVLNLTTKGVYWGNNISDLIIKEILDVTLGTAEPPKRDNKEKMAQMMKIMKKS